MLKFYIYHLIASVITLSVFSKSSWKGISFTAIGSCTVNSRVLPILKGKEPHRVIFQALLIVTGTTKADGAYLQRIFNPFSAKDFGTPVMLRVPSGISPLNVFLTRYIWPLPVLLTKLVSHFFYQ